MWQKHNSDVNMHQYGIYVGLFKTAMISKVIPLQHCIHNALRSEKFIKKQKYAKCQIGTQRSWLWMNKLPQVAEI